jgi:hypothetical protein
MVLLSVLKHVQRLPNFPASCSSDRSDLIVKIGMNRGVNISFAVSAGHGVRQENIIGRQSYLETPRQLCMILCPVDVVHIRICCGPYTVQIGRSIQPREWVGLHALHFLACTRTGLAHIKKPDERVMRKHIVRVDELSYSAYVSSVLQVAVMDQNKWSRFPM